MSRFRRQSGRALTWLLILGLALGACTGDPLTYLQKNYLTTPFYIDVNANFCLSAPNSSKQKVKYLFILDKSGSNQPGFPLVPGDDTNTDPTGSRRYGPLIQFLLNLPVDPNQTDAFSMIGFNDNGFMPSSPNAVNGFDPSEANFQSVVTNEWIGLGTANNPQPNDHGFTNYVSALSLAYQIIDNDAKLEAANIVRPIVTSAYRIIFVSDGQPVVPQGTSLYTQQFTADIEPQIDNILSLKNDPTLGPYIADIVINTAYYFNNVQIQGAITLLQQMASYGNGQFMMFGTGENVIYGAFAPPIRNVRQILSDVFVDNESVVWWDDGTLQMDTDGDGLPDFMEDQLGSNSTNKDTDGNGVSDYVEYRLKGQPCQDSACSPANRNPFSLCDGLNPQVDASGNITYADSDNDGLNDCEEFLLRSDRANWDSNGDFIPDFLAMKNGVPYIAGTQGAFVQPQADGLWNYTKIKMGLPTQVPKDKVPTFQTRATSITKTDQLANNDRDCYNVTVSQVAALGQNNLIRFYVIENSAIIDNKPTMRIGEKRISPGSLSISFSDSEIQ